VDWFEIKGKSFREEKAAKFAEQKGCKNKRKQHKKIPVVLAKKCMLDTLDTPCIVIMGGCKCKSTAF
jgi:hypothetical protein